MRSGSTQAGLLRVGLALGMSAAGLVVAACRPNVDPVTQLEPVSVVTGWYDEGIVEGGKNKLVPAISLRFRNKTSGPVRSIQVNAIFRRVGEAEMWGEWFGWAVPREPLAPGAETPELLLKSALGYTGIQPRLQMLQNKEFVDARVELFLRSGSRTWSKLAEYPIQRQLMTRSRSTVPPPAP